MNITKSAPLPERPCEQLTCCEKNGSVQGNYINRVAKRHNCRITGKTKATRYGGPSTQATRYPQRMSIANNATFAAGGQCDQCAGLLVGYSCSLALRCFSAARANQSLYMRRGIFFSSLLHTRSLLTCSLLMQFPRRKANKNKEPSQYSTCCISYSLSDSLVFFRWRRLISPRMAALINCPVLSPSSFTFSMPSIISWAIRAVTDCDFAFFGPVAMSNPSCFWCKTIYTKKNYFKGLTCKTLLFYVVSYTLSVQGSETAKPVGAANTHRLLTTNDSNSIEVAMLNHITHPQGRDSHNLNKFTWRFIAFGASDHQIIHVTAWTEREARNLCPSGCVAVFAAKICQGVSHV
ncbi:host cell division inhibitor Icd-like protein [Escherichia coli]|nr:host cell division inhibitor Icd-like protein [Escherichia coli]EEX5383258.1 host cell division inhibitor Icd-like protein [Escherichia coli]EFK6851200.1 host cell division inhibitor Icd-like protein [Escherichia coli]EFL3920738.1 host cell division inhibitor Icd-like protein [Escherichia coli]EFM4168762.1 host cell division inhibitor Icd-like protein [Escherichia coli]